MTRFELETHILEAYHVKADYPWITHPAYGVFRHETNKKWFAVAMKIPKNKLDSQADRMIDIVNVKCDPILVGSLRLEQGFYPAYHMSKTNWVTIALDGTVDAEKVKWLLDMSYELTKARKRERPSLN